MSPVEDSIDSIYYIKEYIFCYTNVSRDGTVRPVITLKKVNYDEEIKNDGNNKDNKEIVNVPDTFLKKSVTIVIIGVITSYIVINKKSLQKTSKLFLLL